MKVTSGTLAVIAAATSVNALSVASAAALTASRAATGDILQLLDTIRRRAEFDSAATFIIDMKGLKIYAMEQNGHANTATYLAAQTAVLEGDGHTGTYEWTLENTGGLFEAKDYWTPQASAAADHQLAAIGKVEVTQDIVPFGRTINLRKGSTPYTSTGWATRPAYTAGELIAKLWGYYEDNLDPAGTSSSGSNEDVPFFTFDDKTGKLKMFMSDKLDAPTRVTGLAATVPGAGANVIGISVTAASVGGPVTVSDPTRRIQG